MVFGADSPQESGQAAVSHIESSGQDRRKDTDRTDNDLVTVKLACRK